MNQQSNGKNLASSKAYAYIQKKQSVIENNYVNQEAAPAGQHLIKRISSGRKANSSQPPVVQDFPSATN